LRRHFALPATRIATINRPLRRDGCARGADPNRRPARLPRAMMTDPPEGKISGKAYLPAIEALSRLDNPDILRHYPIPDDRLQT
jgi:hypothetical protein